MSGTQRRRTAGQHDPMAPLYGLAAAVVVALLVVYGCWRIGLWFSGFGPVPANPVDAAVGVARGRLPWPGSATVLVVTCVLAAALVGVWWGRRWTAGARLREFDRAARFMADPSDMSGVRQRDAKKSARRLVTGMPINHRLRYGLLLGRMVGSGRSALYMSWEWVGLIVGGPRSGKSAAFIIPMICQAPGPVVATSNKSDVHDATRWVRDRTDPPGTATAVATTTGWTAVRTWWRTRHQPPRARGKIWLSDLQNIASDNGAEWWWDVLARIHNLADAREVAAIFAGAETEESARVDAYFDGGAKELLALHMLAAALPGGDMLHVDGWLSDPRLEVARELLARHNQPAAAAKLRTASELNPRQQDGLYDMARRFINVMSVPEYAQTVLPPQRTIFPGDSSIGNLDVRHNLPQFRPEEFAASTDTLYALSLESAGAATALTTALVDAVLAAGVELARRSPRGRLPVPMLAALDEAANVCKIPHLPDWYSHFGSQGIVVVTALQSLAQAAKVWSAEKLEVLRDAANVYTYAGSSNNDTWLSSWSHLIGSRDVRRSSRSGSSDSTTVNTSQSWSKEPILDVDALKALPGERAIISTSGNRVAAIEKNFWWNGPYADLIETSRTLTADARNTRTTRTSDKEAAR